MKTIYFLILINKIKFYDIFYNFDFSYVEFRLCIIYNKIIYHCHAMKYEILYLLTK